MRDVLVVLFWLWLLIALCVYGYRIWRRASQGTKAQREAARQAADDQAPTRTGLLGRSAPPPLPDGPAEARLPRALQEQAPEHTGDPGGDPSTAPPSTDDELGVGTTVVAPVAVPLPLPPRLTVAEVLEGIRMPDQLLPVVDAADPDRDRLVRFAGTGTTVDTVTTQLADELRRLGFAVDGLQTATPARAGLTAQRDGATVSAAVSYDTDSTAVVVELSV